MMFLGKKRLVNKRTDLRVFYLLVICGVCQGYEDNRNPYIKDAGPLVETNNGKVIGKYVETSDGYVAAFLGIPFAKPPMGEQRFGKPEPVDNWDGTLFATEKSPACMQYSSRIYGWVATALNTSEDCLYLNIWSPTKCNCKIFEKLPVMVWIHGGGFYSGSSNMDLYDGSILASRGDVVVVNLNYRVGIFGFINAGTNDAPGNAGMHDQLLALQWVKENIELFGGDPNRITVFGESAGSISISMHIISPLSQNLFQRAILHSGTTYQPQFADHFTVSLHKANTYAEIVGCSNEESNIQNSANEVIACLKGKTSGELAEAEDILTSKFPLFFAPSYGGGNEFLPDSPIEVINSGNFNDVPILIGSNKDEATIFMNYIMPDIFRLDQRPFLTIPQGKEVLKNILASAPQVPADEVIEYYFQNVTEDYGHDIIEAISNAFGDYVFSCPGMIFAEKGREAYIYWFTHRSGKEPNNEWMGVPHFYAVPFIFGKPLVDSTNYTPEDARFSEGLMQKLVAFARDGSPFNKSVKIQSRKTAGREQTWPKFSSINNPAYELNSESERSLPFPRKEACEFLRPFYR